MQDLSFPDGYEYSSFVWPDSQPPWCIVVSTPWGTYEVIPMVAGRYLLETWARDNGAN